jgi:ribosome-associated toxin RatA of RatAB toxin-antitoxin module
MSVSGSETITINAPVADVLAIIRDVDNQSTWFPGNLESEVLETDDAGLPTKARMVNDVKVAKDEFELSYTHTDTGMSWSLVAPSKAQKGQEGSWSLADKGGQTEATMTLTVDSTLPLPGFMQKKIVKDTLNNATKALKKRAESS